MIQITEKIIPVNRYNRPGTASKPTRICVHYTGEAGTGADRLALFYSNVAAGMFPGQSASWTSTQYIVGLSGEVIRIVPDNEVAYAAANRNNGTIHIEVCYKQQSGEFEQASKAALRKLVQYLMQKYAIPADKVVRHY
ncbi:MAG: N-acetylmuramoyl-L-alanine amidase family protein, partial [Oscillospiraceae bacterium]